MRVNTEELNRQAIELRRISARINDIEDIVQRTTRDLCRERFGERFRSPLNTMARAIAGHSEELNRMSSALLQIGTLYERTENRILDEADHANVHYDHEFPTLIPIPLPDNWFIPLTGIRPIRYWDIPVSPDPAEDVMVVDGLPTLNDIGWEEAVEHMFDNPDDGPHNNVTPVPTPELTEQMRDALEEVLDRQHGRGYIPPVEIPVIGSIDLPRSHTGHPMADYIGAASILENADTILDTSGLIDWTPWDA